MRFTLFLVFDCVQFHKFRSVLPSFVVCIMFRSFLPRRFPFALSLSRALALPLWFFNFGCPRHVHVYFQKYSLLTSHAFCMHALFAWSPSIRPESFPDPLYFHIIVALVAFYIFAYSRFPEFVYTHALFVVYRCLFGGGQSDAFER